MDTERKRKRWRITRAGGGRKQRERAVMHACSIPSEIANTRLTCLLLPSSQMPLPALLHVRPWLRRSTRISPPSSPRIERGPAIGNLEDAVGAVERWWVEGRERTAARGWRGWVSRAPLIGESAAGSADQPDPSQRRSPSSA